MSTYLGTYTGRRGEPQVFFSDLDRVTYAIGHRLATDGYDTRSEEIRRPAPINESDVISSELPDGRHAPCIDVDVKALLLPSSTPGHGHLYIEKPMSWFRYRVMLRAMVFAGVVEPGYYRAGVARRGTHLRLPWVEKERS